MTKMFTRLLIVTAFIYTPTHTLQAMHHDSGASHKHNKGEIVKVKVHGMVCDFCVTSIKKRFMKQKEVKDISVNLDNMTITIEHMPGKKLSEKEIKKQVKKAGYKYKGLISSEE